MQWFDKCWGCHQIPERSFFIKNYQLPICARCSGVLIGYLLALLFFNIDINILILFIFMGIMFIDYFLHFKNILISNNYRRLLTGILGDFGLLKILIQILKYILFLLINIIL